MCSLCCRCCCRLPPPPNRILNSSYTPCSSSFLCYWLADIMAIVCNSGLLIIYLFHEILRKFSYQDIVFPFTNNLFQMHWCSKLVPRMLYTTKYACQFIDQHLNSQTFDIKHHSGIVKEITHTHQSLSLFLKLSIGL